MLIENIMVHTQNGIAKKKKNHVDSCYKIEVSPTWPESGQVLGHIFLARDPTPSDFLG